MRTKAKKIQKSSVKSEEILVSDLAARAVFGQSPLLEKIRFSSFVAKILLKILQAYHFKRKKNFIGEVGPKWLKV